MPRKVAVYSDKWALIAGEKSFTQCRNMLADNALGRKDFAVPPFAKVRGIRPKWKVLRVVAIHNLASSPNCRPTLV